MAFSRKAQLVRALRNKKRRLECYKRSGMINTDEGRRLLVRIERQKKDIQNGKT